MLAVGKAGLALRFACEELRQDKEVVLHAVAQRPGALVYASGP